LVVDVHPVARVATDMVGRDQVLSDLVALLADARGGRGRSVLLLGEPGIGKSTLAEAVAAYGASSGFQTARGWCSAAGMPPYWPWRRALQSCGIELDTGADRDGLLSSLVRGLETASQARPLLIVVEDLQWTDLPSLTLLRTVVDALPALPVALVLTSRDDPLEVPAEVRDRLADLPPGVRRVQLPRLDGAAVAALVSRVAGRELPGPVVADVLARTGGNPFFVCEVARLLTAPAAGAPVVPAGVREVLERRLARLSQPCHGLLGAAAVASETARTGIDTTLLCAVCGVDELHVAGLLDEAVRARLVIHEPARAARFRFTHALVREVLVLGLPLAERARLHEGVARVLEETGSGRGHADRVTYHWSQSSGAQAAAATARWALRAAREAMAALGFEQAAINFRRALGGRDVDRVAVLIELGEALRLSGDPVGARESFVEAAELAEADARAEDLARAALGLGGGLAGFEVTVADEQQVDLLRRADAALPAGDQPLRAAVRARLSLSLGGLASERERRLLAEEAVAMAARTAPGRVEAAALAAYCDAVAGPDYVIQRQAAAERMLALATGDRVATLLARRLRLVACLEQGDFAAADADIDGFQRTADAAGIPFYQWLPAIWRGTRALLAGDVPAAFDHAARAARVADRAGSENAALMVFTLRMHAHLTRGTTAVYAEEVRRVTGELVGRAPALYLAQPALVLLAAGQPAEAESVLRWFLATPDGDMARDAEWLESHWALAEIATTLGNRDAAARLFDTLRPYERLWAVDGIGGAVFGTVGHQLGRLAAFLGRRREATGYLRTARETYHSAGASLLAAQLGAVLAGLGVTPAPAPQQGRFHRDGRVWQVGWQGRASVVPDAKGMRDLAILLSRPNRPVAALDLVAAAAGPDANVAGADLGPVLDATARQAYRTRLADLDAAIATAIDAGRLQRLHAERDAIAHELAGALGLGGRPRQAGDPVDRARKAVTMRIRAALRAIESADPALARHLGNAVKTGRSCTYQPDGDVTWQT
jgi:tetratricopeptide (TPR) repeat protein